ncbi:MAG: S8 family serine peptidase, partial [Thermoanaerobaculia bacterium]
MKTRSLCGWSAAVLLLGSSLAQAQAQAADESRLILLNSHVIDTGRSLPAIPEALRAPGADPAAGETVLVKFPGPITAQQERALREASLEVYTYLPHYAYLAKMPAGWQQKARALGATWAGLYHPWYKMSRQVSEVQAFDFAQDALGAREQPRIVMLQVFPDADVREVVRQIRDELGVPGVVGWGRGARFSRVRLLLTPSEIAAHREALAQLGEVFWIDVEPRRVLLNDTTVWVGQSGLSGGQTTPIFSQGIFGEGQTVGIVDTGIDPDMCWFRDTALGLPPTNACNGGTVANQSQRKVVAVDFLASGECSGGIGSTEWDTQDHGSHVAGTVAGDNFANLLLHDAADGMAPGAKLVIQDAGYTVDNCGDLPGIGCPVVDLNPIFQQAYSQGARLHTNSWGDNENAAVQSNYSSGSQDVDEFMWNHKDFLIFFAAGNEGQAPGRVVSPSTAKNGVSVGATQRGSAAGEIAFFSSCGPTADGRIKPDIMAPGLDILSANNDFNIDSNNCDTRTMNGTSMAAPGAVGLTALVRQYYTDGWYPGGAANEAQGFTPS